MTKGLEALVNPNLLLWARERANYSLEEAAEKARVKVGNLMAWEAGQERPSVPQARRLATVYKTALAVFYLPDPPKGFDVLKNYRRIPGLVPGKESPDLRFAMRMAEYRREGALAIAKDLGEHVRPFRYRAGMEEDPEALANRIRGTLKVPLAVQKRTRTIHDALTLWREAVESLGVLVFQAPRISVDEMRGVCIPHNPFPIILLNSADAPAGRIFSLLHEFVHLWLIGGGHRQSASELMQEPEKQPTEVFANRVTAGILLPADSFLAEREVQHAGSLNSWEEPELSRLAGRYSVSVEVVLRRLLSLKRTDKKTYEAFRAKWLGRPLKRAAEVKIPQHVKALSQLGRSFTRLIFEGYHESRISLSTLSDYLGVKVCHIPKIESDLGKRLIGRS